MADQSGSDDTGVTNKSLKTCSMLQCAAQQCAVVDGGGCMLHVLRCGFIDVVRNCSLFCRPHVHVKSRFFNVDPRGKKCASAFVIHKRVAECRRSDGTRVRCTVQGSCSRCALQPDELPAMGTQQSRHDLHSKNAAFSPKELYNLKQVWRSLHDFRR